MARPKNYQRLNVLDAAMDTFWKYGYEGTSLSKLVQHTGLNKKSLYNEFGSKADIFQEVLEHYKKTMIPHQEHLARVPLSPQNVLNYFKDIASQTYNRTNGCLLTLCLNETYQVESTHAEFARNHYIELESSFYKNLNSNPKVLDADVLAKYLTSSVLGLTSWIRLKPSKEEYRRTIDTIVSILKLRLEKL
ncbi:TetR/AcrR family transcriptional regulator [Vibrio sp. MA64]|uniref:TetR/AcrR family transcriptional regulator n=1 Tax=Vibrio sp. MA64 TaxID=2896365 RepID=UPI001E2DF46D|nr:TetR/AcrR family transcriptional regulator [Vibrio sp. MA64]MCC9650186.1 TetR/AcrR family transcriptional regulator [Vibrio sp. MA64]